MVEIGLDTRDARTYVWPCVAAGGHPPCLPLLRSLPACSAGVHEARFVCGEGTMRDCAKALRSWHFVTRMCVERACSMAAGSLPTVLLTLVERYV